VAAHSTAAEKCESVAQLPSAGVPVQLCDLADGSLARTAGAQVPLRTDSCMHALVLSRALTNRLRHCMLQLACVHEDCMVNEAASLCSYKQYEDCVGCAQEKLVACLRGVLRQRLEALGWPPPVTVGSGASSSSRNTSEEEWQGFTQADPLVENLSPSYLYEALAYSWYLATFGPPCCTHFTIAMCLAGIGRCEQNRGCLHRSAALCAAIII
jgi:hypothetical protein